MNDSDYNDRTRRDQALFDGIAESYCRKDLSLTSRPARKFRLLQSLKSVGIPRDCKLLEVGCGAGFAADYAQGVYSHYTGIDHSQRLIDLSQELNGAQDREFRAVDVNAFEPGERFNVVLMIGVLHHLPEKEQVIATLTQMLTPDGWIILNEPHPGNPLISIARWARKRIDPSYSDDQEELSWDKLEDLFDSSRFELVLKPQGYFSTPFAEVPLNPGFLFAPLSHLAVLVDRGLEQVIPKVIGRFLSWNLVVAARIRRDPEPNDAP